MCLSVKNSAFLRAGLAGILALLVQILPFLAGLGPAYAGRPMQTDDADLIDAGSCQLEAWIDRNRDSTELWAVPSCNPGGNLELSAGGALVRQESDTDVAALLQGKTLFKKMQPNGWGIGLAGGVEHRPQDSGGVRDWYAYIPLSKSFRDDRTLVHANLGWLHDGEEKRNRMTWGLGGEIQLAERHWLMAEIFGHDRGTPLYQLGFGYWPIGERLQLDAAYGQGFGNGETERWFSLGLTWVFLP